MSELICLKCQNPLDMNAESCPNCGEKVTGFQRTYAGKLIDGKYQILERLGVGGMGEIFKVRHIHLNEQRVIKIMRANIASDEQALQRFLHEARLATMIKHRNLAMLYDFSTLDDGSYYMVWEYIEGTNIQKWIATNGPVPPRLAVEMSIQALSGLEAIHQMGIIHRDISPENIMLSQDQMGRLLVKVIDFGIAKQLDDAGSGHGLTQTGMFLGKLKYASPEQAGFIKEGETLDARSDLYSFGIVMYEMLAGRAPFLATNPHGYILKHATEKPAPFKEIAPNVDVPPKLEAIVMKSLEKDRDNRQANTGELIDELEAIRNEITPDSKFGVGERMMTLSSRPTAVDVRPTASGRHGTGTVPGTAPGTTKPGTGAHTPVPPLRTPTRATPMATRTGQQDATVVESRSTMTGGNEATVVERVGGDAGQATVVERVADVAERPTPLQRTVSDVEIPKKSKAPLFIGIAALLLILAGAGVWIKTHPKTDVVEHPVTDTTGTGTATTTTAQPMTADVATLNIAALGTIHSITNLETNKPVAVKEEDVDTPAQVYLPPGHYAVEIEGPDRAPRQRKDVTLAAKQVQTLTWDDVPDLETVANDVLNKEVAQ